MRIFLAFKDLARTNEIENVIMSDDDTQNTKVTTFRIFFGSRSPGTITHSRVHNINEKLKNIDLSFVEFNKIINYIAEIDVNFDEKITLCLCRKNLVMHYFLGELTSLKMHLYIEQEIV